MEQRTPRHWSRDRHPDRLRLLVESPARAFHDADFSVFEQAGFDVAVCTGPDSEAACPLVEWTRCPLAQGADVVLFGLGLTDDRHREVLRALRRELPATPVVVEFPRGGREREGVPEGCVALAFPTSVDGQVRVLKEALAAARERRRPRLSHAAQAVTEPMRGGASPPRPTPRTRSDQREGR